MARNLEERMDARQIVNETGMSARPEYYSGRGAITCDLNDTKLEKIYQGIEREHGKEAASQFAQMVADIPQLTATDFLLTLYTLERDNWKWDKKRLGNERGVYVDGETDRAKMLIGHITIAHALQSDHLRDETWSIRTEFCRRHGIETPQSDQKVYGNKYF